MHMPSATRFPLPIGLPQFKAHFLRLNTALTMYSRETGMSIADIMESKVRAAMDELESMCHQSFFVTRYCTEVLGRIKNREILNAGGSGFVLGTDYDRICQPRDYNMQQWQNCTGRLQTDRKPINEVVDYRLALRGGETDDSVATIPNDWLQWNSETGDVHILANSLTTGATIFYSLFSIFPFYRPGMTQGWVPVTVHMCYTAGLVGLDMSNSYTSWDPTNACKWDTPESGDGTWNPVTLAGAEIRWGMEKVRNYQLNIAKMAGAAGLKDLANWIDGGGKSISMDGLSATVNPGVLEQRASALDQEARAWATTFDPMGGTIIVCA